MYTTEKILLMVQRSQPERSVVTLYENLLFSNETVHVKDENFTFIVSVRELGRGKSIDPSLLDKKIGRFVLKQTHYEEDGNDKETFFESRPCKKEDFKEYLELYGDNPKVPIKEKTLPLMYCFDIDEV